MFSSYLIFFFFLITRRPPRSTRSDTLFPYTPLFRSPAVPGPVAFDFCLRIGRLDAAYIAPLVVRIAHVAERAGRRLVLVLDPREPPLDVVANELRLDRIRVESALHRDLAVDVVVVGRHLLEVDLGDVRPDRDPGHQPVLVTVVFGSRVAERIGLHLAEIDRKSTRLKSSH